jgi:ferredoxin
MTYRITEACIECGRCVAVCPAQAISVVEKHHRIDPDICDGIAMCVRYCPEQGAIIRVGGASPTSAREVGIG